MGTIIGFQPAPLAVYQGFFYTSGAAGNDWLDHVPGSNSNDAPFCSPVEGVIALVGMSSMLVATFQLNLYVNASPVANLLYASAQAESRVLATPIAVSPGDNISSYCLSTTGGASDPSNLAVTIYIYQA